MILLTYITLAYLISRIFTFGCVKVIPIKKSCTGCNKRKEVIRKYTQIGYFTLNLDDAKEYLYAKSTKRRILSWRDIHVNVFI